MEATTADIATFVDKADEQKAVAELAVLPTDALQGVSPADAAAPQQTFGVKTTCQLAENKLVTSAQATTLLAGAK